MRHERTELILEAPVSTVWQVLTDFGSYPGWTDDMRFASPPRKGHKARLTVRLLRGRPVTTDVRILVVDPERELRWRGGIPGVMTGDHYFLLEALGERTRLIHGEIFEGVAVQAFWTLTGPDIAALYPRINRALEARCLKMVAPSTR